MHHYLPLLFALLALDLDPILDARAFRINENIINHYSKSLSGGIFHVNVGRNRSPPTRVVDGYHETVLLIEIPGMGREDVKINLQDDVLIVTGKSSLCPEESEDKACVLQPLEKEFETRFSLKHPSQNIWAEVKLGILYIHIPKKSETNKIPIRFNESDQNQPNHMVHPPFMKHAQGSKLLFKNHKDNHQHKQHKQNKQNNKQHQQQEQSLHDFEFQSGLMA